mmetsp:Transcript_76284/g.151196  ORF Transcript_76284/g.151196 Transcript_76284/m.151196 type:complete len:274 (-) Transcript_76284:327-1148(-)
MSRWLPLSSFASAPLPLCPTSLLLVGLTSLSTSAATASRASAARSSESPSDDFISSNSLRIFSSFSIKAASSFFASLSALATFCAASFFCSASESIVAMSAAIVLRRSSKSAALFSAPCKELAVFSSVSLVVDKSVSNFVRVASHSASACFFNFSWVSRAVSALFARLSARERFLLNSSSNFRFSAASLFATCSLRIESASCWFSCSISPRSLSSAPSAPLDSLSIASLSFAAFSSRANDSSSCTFNSFISVVACSKASRKVVPSCCSLSNRA